MSRHLRVLRESGLVDEAHPAFDARVRIYCRTVAVTSRVLVALRIAASREQVFEAFTNEIVQWWRQNALFQFTEYRTGRMAFEPGPDGRLIETYDGGDVFEIGRIREWEPPTRLVFSWRQSSFSAEQETEVHVRFEPIGRETRVTVEHFGWDTIAQEHAARHSFPLLAFQQRHAKWWQSLLQALDDRIASPWL